jgi:phenylalanyl-tRNA synthetase beta chain
MKVPLSWLRELVAVEVPVAELTSRLTMAGLEVEDVRLVGADWEGVTIARVAELERLPKSDHLYVAQLDLGDRQTTVVTGAPNLFVGAIVPHVASGGRLPAGEVGSRALAGVVSEGMVCSGDELDVSPDRDGIYLLESDAPVGTPFAQYLDETVLDVYITPNRPDCMSMVGIAREVHALTGGAFTPFFDALQRTPPPHGETPASSLLSVRIEDPRGCPRFTAALVHGAEIGASPPWMQRRLHFAGLRPISNVVDVTNYVMLELGQPLHAFDRGRLVGGTIVVRRAREGERLTTLDGEERVLSASMMVVADETAARSLAGIMGGADSEISDATRDIVLEGANWDRATTRLTAAALGLNTEAARRFGRGVDPDLTATAVSRATMLTLEVAGGQAANGLVDSYPGRQSPPVVRARPSQIDALLGATYSREVVVSSLSSLGFQVDGADGSGELVVHVPGYRRFDVAHRADLAEEVARVVGYDSIPAAPLDGRLPQPRADGDRGFGAELRARGALASAGLQEVMTYSLVDPALAERVRIGDVSSQNGRTAADANGAASWPLLAEPEIAVANPISPEHSVLRASLLGSLLETLNATLRHRQRVLLFELARTWRRPLTPLPDERRHVGIAMTGSRLPEHWSATPDPLDFFDAKGIVEQLGDALGVPLTFSAMAHPSLHPTRAARVRVADGPELGLVGQLHPLVAERFDLDARPVLVAELDFEALLAAQPSQRVVVRPSRFPAAERDVAVVVDESVNNGDVEAVIRDAGAPLLREARLFDVYRGEPVPAGRKNLAYALTYQAPDRTLEEVVVAEAHVRVERALTDAFHAEIRGREGPS